MHIKIECYVIKVSLSSWNGWPEPRKCNFLINIDRKYLFTKMKIQNKSVKACEYILDFHQPKWQ